MTVLAPSPVTTCRSRQSRPTLDEAGVAPTAARGAAAAAGEEWAWEAIVHRYEGLVGAITRSFRIGWANADDVAQTVWLRLFEHLPRLREPEALGAWVAAVTRNCCLRLQKRLAREVAIDDLDADLVSEEAVEAGLLVAERSAALRRALIDLPARRRQLLEALLDQPELTHDELGRRFGMAAGSVGPTRCRSIEKLRACPALAGLGN